MRGSSGPPAPMLINNGAGEARPPGVSIRCCRDGGMATVAGGNSCGMESDGRGMERVESLRAEGWEWKYCSGRGMDGVVLQLVAPEQMGEERALRRWKGWRWLSG